MKKLITKQQALSNPEGLIPLQFLTELGNAIKWLRPKRAIIFGSTVRNGLSFRDIDLLVLSELFGSYLWQDRFEMINLPKDYIYDLRLFTPAEFETFYPVTSPIRKSLESQYIDLKEYYV